jgi:peptidoglycan/xylan/chitin deacetylase (PgdA/CDA1 family)
VRRTRALWLGVSLLLTAAAVGAVLILTEQGRSARAEIRSLIATGYPIYCGGGTRPFVALTFDDGPTRWTPQLVRVLRANGAQATFFEVGEKAVARPDLVRLESGVGEVGDHSWSHPSLTTLPNAKVVGQLESQQDAVERITGTRPNLFRPPFAAHDARVDSIAADLGLLDVLWNIDSGDASGASTPSSSRIAQNLTQRIRAGGIVLLHEDETVPRAIEAMKLFLPQLRQLGLHAVTVSNLLRLGPPNFEELPNGEGGCNSTWRR